jgi:hypothetical protein
MEAPGLRFWHCQSLGAKGYSQLATVPRDGGPELQGDVVRVAEGQGEAGRVLGDDAVLDPEFVQTALPLLELAAVGATKADVVQPRTELTEAMGPVGGRVRDQPKY